MTPLTLTLVCWLCDPGRREELIGDLTELHARRAARLGRRRARTRLWYDVVMVCFRQSRLRSWSTRQWAVAGALTLSVMAGAARATNGLPTEPYTISATDAGGSFTLRLKRGAVVGATVDGHALPDSRVVQIGSRVILRAAREGGDLEVTIRPDGGIRWEGRPVRRSTQETPIDLSFAHQYFAEAAAASAADNGELWGRPLYGPILLVDPTTRFVVGNEEDKARSLTPMDGLFTGSWPNEQNIANTALTWNGKHWSMIKWPLPANAYGRRKLVAHELFHRIQSELRLEMEDEPNAHLATRDGRIWMRLEMRALAEALLAERNDRRGYIEDALRFRARRRALAPAAATREERRLELSEGLAEYTGLKLSGVPARFLTDRAAEALLEREQTPSFSRSFAYATGPAYGLLLDERAPKWRRTVSPATELGDLLAEAYHLHLDTAAAKAEEHAVPYDGRRVIAEETAAAAEVAAREGRLRARLVDGPVVSFPVAAKFRYGFDPNAATPLPEMGTVYEAARVTDEWGVLTVASGGVLLARRGTSIVRVAVPVAAGGDTPPLAGEGWRLELAAGWTVVPDERAGSWVVRRAP